MSLADGTDRPSHSRRRGPARGGLTRRAVLRLGAAGLTLPQLLAWRAAVTEARGASASPAGAAAARSAPGSTTRGFGRAKSCIVLYAWGGMSHLDTFDLKPGAASNIRSIFKPIKTSTPGVYICEHLPRLAKQTHRMAIVRSMNHKAPSHRSAAYWNLTGHPPVKLDKNWPATRDDWPCIGSMVWQAVEKRQSDEATQQTQGAMPGAFALPYPMYDGGHANGQDGGFLGLAWDPVIVRPKQGKPYEGKSPDYGNIDLSFIDGVDRHRLLSRRSLFEALDTRGPLRTLAPTAGVQRYQRQALDMLLAPNVRDAFDLEKEPAALRQRYGMHICGQSTLMARKLTEAGVPLVTVYCAAGDLNGSVGAHWDTHGDGFNRLKNQMLPPLDQASAALLDDLAARGTLDQTLVVWLTEFGRTPKLSGGGGRGHYPNVYSVALAGGGVGGGQVYGSSDASGAYPKNHPCGPADLHATIFHALGIAPTYMVHDQNNRPLRMCDGKVLPVFG